MKNYILDSGLLSEKTTNAYSILFYITPLLNSIEATTNDAFEEINDHNELGREDYTSIKSNIENINDYMNKYKTFGAVTSGAGQNNSSGYNYNYGGNNQYQSSTTGYSNNDGFIGEYQREVDNIFSNAQSNTVNKLSESKLQDIRVNNNLEIKSELPASPLNMQVKKSTVIDKKEIGIEDLLDSGTISVVMQKEYNDMKVEIEAQNKSLPEYNSADYPKYLPGFIKEDLYEAKIDEERIDNCDEYVNKIVTSADFDYETDIEKTVSTTLDFVPFVGQGKMALEAVLGIDLVSGRHLSKEEQLLILGTMGLGSIVEDGYKGIKAGMASEAEQTTSKTVLSMGIGGSSGEIEKLMKSATEKILSKRKAMLEAEEAIAKVEGEDAINAALKDADIAAEVSTVGKADIKLGKDDIDAYRAEIGVPKRDTVAVGKIDVSGLEDYTFKGASPQVRIDADLNDLDEIFPNRSVKAPWDKTVRGHGQFTRHAEEGVMAEFENAVNEAGLKADDVKGILYIHQSNPNGVCSMCTKGLFNPVPKEENGIFKQFTEMYPNLTIKVTTEINSDLVYPRNTLSFDVTNGEVINVVKIRRSTK